MNTLLNHTIKKGIILALIISIITIPPFTYAQKNGLDNQPPIASSEPSISNQPKSPSTLEQEEIARRIAEAGAAAAAQAVKAAALAHFKRTIISILGNENASSTSSGEITPEPSDTETNPNISPGVSLPPDNGGSTGNIISQAERIIPRLQKGLGDLYNSHTQIIPGPNGYKTPYRSGRVAGIGPDGLFWCTNMVISAYRLAGYNELKEGTGMESVVFMREWWQKQKPGYYFVPFSNKNDKQTKINALKRVKPGCAFFLEYAGQHTGLVKSINVNPTHGNGDIWIYESNSGRTLTKFDVSKGSVERTYGMTLTGFGCRY